MSIDLNFRPESYADFDDPVALALNGIKGQMRREMVRDMLTAEGDQRKVYDLLLGPVEEDVLGEEAPGAFTHALNRRYGPGWLGGEYLPNLEAGEVEIARIVLDSATMDVFSMRARLEDGVYHHRLVDEYEGDFWVEPEQSGRPLSMAELVSLIDTAEGGGIERFGRTFVEGWWWQQFRYDDPLEHCTAFCRVESEQYPQLAAYYEERARLWRIARAKELR